MDRRADTMTDECVGDWVDGQVDGLVKTCVDGMMELCVDGSTAEGMCNHMLMEGNVDGLMEDVRMEGLTEV
jgi:hypothetical protein